ncbi:MAG: TetR/AcrR family transcriptional regulator [Sneathiellales bacterium]|nr:TetR/AcrR family transcriptional regulator [Sneathiellales bacterium]
MTDRESIILDASLRLFMRYGVKRTSMGDVAEEAGVSRQTLYNSFKNKGDILRAQIERYTENAIAEINAGTETMEDLGAKLDLVFEQMVVVGFDMMVATPNVQDLVEGIDASSREELEKAAQRFQGAIEQILQPYEQALEQSGLCAADLADFAQRSASAAKRSARDRDHLLRLLSTLRNLCLKAAEETRH